MSEINNYCSLCSLACPLVFKGGKRSPSFTKDSILSIDWDEREGSKFGGSLCARGNSAVELLSHPKRLNYSFVLGKRTSFDEAVKETAKNLASIKSESGADSIGVLIGENLTNEEAALALKFAKDVIGTSNVELFAPDDTPLFSAYLDCDLSSLSPTAKKPEGTKSVYLMIGDSFSDHPCTAKTVLAGKNAGRGNEIIVISPELNHTAWFAGRHLACLPGGETAVVAGLLKSASSKSGNPLTPALKKLIDAISWEDIEKLGGIEKKLIENCAGAMLGAAKIETYLSNIFGRLSFSGLLSLFAEALTMICPGDKLFEPQFVQQNSWGIYSVLAGAGCGSVIGKLETKEIDALVILGLDIFSVYPAGPVEKALREKKFTVATQLFWGQTSARSNVVIPAACLMEKKGTVSPSFKEDVVREDVIDPPAGAYSEGEFLRALAKEMGAELGEASVERKTARSGSGEGLTEKWTKYCNSVRGFGSAPCVLMPWSEAVHAADGSVTRNLHWSRVTCPEPQLFISREIASSLELTGGDRVKVSSGGGEEIFKATVSKKLSGNTAAASIHFPSVRKLFPWSLDEKTECVMLAPVPVNLERQSEKS
ncbi:MAG: molybdopterin-dependent oxidoreductase [Candidatus Krumholzibacteriota bacterium]|nr:molybdopterin-dependent oxidoreductase [Candidatus Krumholzibacteriota bacterium]